MKISIKCSLTFAETAISVKKELEEAGHQVTLPNTIQVIANGTISFEEVMKMKEENTLAAFTKFKDLIRWNYNDIKQSDAVLIINLEKKGIKNYIGPATFMEIGFAHVLDKKIFLWNDIPDLPNREEVEAMEPMVINQEVLKIM